MNQRLKELQELQISMQTSQMSGQAPDPETIKRIQSLSTMAATKPLAAQYLAAQGAYAADRHAYGRN